MQFIFFLKSFSGTSRSGEKNSLISSKGRWCMRGSGLVGPGAWKSPLRQVTTATASGLPLCRSWVTGALADAQASNQSSFPDIIFPAVAYFQMCFSISIICSAYETVRHSYLGFITFGFLQIFLYMNFCTRSYGVYILLKLWALQNKSFFLAEWL